MIMRNKLPAGHRLEVYCCLPLRNIRRGHISFVAHHSRQCPTGVSAHLRLDEDAVIAGIDVSEDDSEIALKRWIIIRLWRKLG